MKHTIKVKGCFECPFRDNEFTACEILGTNEFPVEHESWYGVSVAHIRFNGFHEKCPLKNFTIEVVKDNE